MAAETAEVVFGAQQTLEGAKEFYSDVKTRMQKIGREEDSLKIMPGLSIMVAESHDEAVDRFEELQDLIDPAVGLQLLSQRMGHDMSGYDINEMMPLLPPDPKGGSRRDLIVKQARRDKLTIKDMYRKNPIKIHYRIKKITTNTKDTYYNPTYEYLDVKSYDIYQNMDIGDLTNINTIRPSKYLKYKLLPDDKYDIYNPYPMYNDFHYTRTTCIFDYVVVDSLKDFINYQLVWKKYKYYYCNKE